MPNDGGTSQKIFVAVGGRIGRYAERLMFINEGDMEITLEELAF